MKTIFRHTSVALLFAAIFAIGAVAVFAQDPCADAEGMAAMDKKVRDDLALKDIDGRRKGIDSGKQFLEKYGSCDAAKLLVDYLKPAIPTLEATLARMIKAKKIADLEGPFITAMTNKNWDEVYVSGKRLLAEDPVEYGRVVFVLGSIGLEETAKSPRVTKWNDETLRYAKQAIQEIEANKSYTQYGVRIKDTNFLYLNKDDALGYMNYVIGYIYTFDKKNKKEALSYLFKASQAMSDTKKNPVLYEAIGSYYFDEAARLEGEIKTMRADIKETDTPEVVKTKVDAMNAKIGMLNGTLERALDAYSRAYRLSPDTAGGKIYMSDMLKKLNVLYESRFDKKVGLTGWVDAAFAKPFVNPSTPITPIIDPEPVTTPSSTTAAPATTPVTAPTKPVAGNGAATTPTKPLVKKPIRKRRTR